MTFARACLASWFATMGGVLPAVSLAQSPAPTPEKLPRVVREAASCARIADATERLACYDDWSA